MFATSLPVQRARRNASATTTSSALAAGTPLYQSLLKKMHAAQLPERVWAVIRDDELQSGQPFPFVAMLRHLLDPAAGPAPLTVADLSRSQPWFVIEREDARFVHVVFRTLRSHFQLKIALSEQQFLKPNQFAADKAALVCDAATVILRWERELCQRRRIAAEAAASSPPRLAQQHYGAKPRGTVLSTVPEGVLNSVAGNSSGCSGGGLKRRYDAPLASGCCGLNVTTGAAHGHDSTTGAAGEEGSPSLPTMMPYRCRYERERAAVEAQSAAIRAELDARHRALSRVARQPPLMRTIAVDRTNRGASGRATSATAADRHGNLDRVALRRASSPQRHRDPMSGEMMMADNGTAVRRTCWYCAAAGDDNHDATVPWSSNSPRQHRAASHPTVAGPDATRCHRCGAPAADQLKRRALNEASLSAHSSTSTSTLTN